MRLAAQLTLVVILISSAVTADLSLSGTVVDCVGGQRYTPSGVQVLAFDSTKVPNLVSLMKTLDSAGDPNPDDDASVKTFLSRYERLTQLIRTSRRILSTKSGSGGLFKMNIVNPPDHMVIVAFAESIDGPANYAYKDVQIVGWKDRALLLNFSHKHCGP